jgi:hypothetical protein
MTDLMLALWSAPRSRSTAFERMMRERGDFTVLHEPFSHTQNYGSTTVDGQEITSEPGLLAALKELGGKVFFKDTTDYYYPHLLADEEFLRKATHTFLIRHPREAIASHYRLHPKLNRDEIGFGWLLEIFEAVRAATGRTPVVVDSGDLLAHPARTVERYCAAVGIPFLADALNWKPEMPGDWRRSRKWHEATSATSGFAPSPGATDTSVEDSPLLSGYLAYHLPFYESLRQHRIKPDVLV